MLHPFSWYLNYSKAIEVYRTVRQIESAERMKKELILELCLGAAPIYAELYVRRECREETKSRIYACYADPGIVKALVLGLNRRNLAIIDFFQPPRIFLAQLLLY